MVVPALRETRGDILEPGPGIGALAVQSLPALERLDALPVRNIVHICTDSSNGRRCRRRNRGLDA